MNIFLPYENNVEESVRTLDDKRLIKQILETYQLLNNAIEEENGIEIKGYKNHPIYKHYKGSIGFLSYYGYECCYEYWTRFQKSHRLAPFFMGVKGLYPNHYHFTPFYMEGSVGQPNYIRTTENVSELYQDKLIKKWENDKVKPKWTNREVPQFYLTYKESKNGRTNQ